MKKKWILGTTAASALILGMLLGPNPSMAMENGDDRMHEDPSVSNSGARKFSADEYIAPNQNTLSELPPEIIFHIAQHLLAAKDFKVNDFQSFGKTCREFHQISQDPVFYLPEKSEDFQKLLKNFIPSCLQKMNLHPLALFISHTPQADERLYQTGMEILNTKIFKPDTVEIDPSGDLKTKFEAAQAGFFFLLLADMLFHNQAAAKRIEILVRNNLLLQSQKNIPFSLHFFPVDIGPVLDSISLDALIERQHLETLFLGFKQTFAQTESRKAFHQEDYNKVQNIQTMYDSKNIFPDPLNTQKNIAKLFSLPSSFVKLPEQKKIFNACEKHLQNLEDYLEDLRQKAGKGPFGTPGTSQEISVLVSIKKVLRDLKGQLAQIYVNSASACEDKAQKAEWFSNAASLFEAVGNKKEVAKSYFEAALACEDKAKKVEWFSKAASLFEAIDHKERAAASYYNTAINTEDKAKKVEWFSKAASLFEATGDKENAARSYFYVGYFSGDKIVKEKAITYACSLSVKEKQSLSGAIKGLKEMALQEKKEDLAQSLNEFLESFDELQPQ